MLKRCWYSVEVVKAQTIPSWRLTLRVALAQSGPAQDAWRDLAQEIAVSRLLSLAQACAPPSVTVRYGPQDEAFATRPLLESQDPARLGQPVPLSRRPGFYLTDESGEPLFGLFIPPDAPDVVSILLDALHKLARQNNLAALENRATPLNAAARRFMLQFRRLDLSNREQAGKIYHSNTGVKVTPAELAVGDGYYLEITNQTDDATLHAYLLNLSTDGAIHVMYPRDCDTAPALAPGETAQSQPFQLKPPLGYEGLKLIVTSQPLHRICALTQSKVSGVAPRQKLLKPLELLLYQAYNGQAAPRDGGGGAGWDTWGTVDTILPVWLPAQPHK